MAGKDFIEEAAEIAVLIRAGQFPIATQRIRALTGVHGAAVVLQIADQLEGSGQRGVFIRHVYEVARRG